MTNVHAFQPKLNMQVASYFNQGNAKHKGVRRYSWIFAISSATPKLKTLLVIPAYNEEDCILSVAKKIESAGYDYIIVNDGSTDSTLRICKSNLNVLDLPRNLGIGGVVQSGHKHAPSEQLRR